MQLKLGHVKPSVEIRAGGQVLLELGPAAAMSSCPWCCRLNCAAWGI